jgi:hypothetical protein
MTALDGWPLVKGPFGVCGTAGDGGLHHGAFNSSAVLP